MRQTSAQIQGRRRSLVSSLGCHSVMTSRAGRFGLVLAWLTFFTSCCAAQEAQPKSRSGYADDVAVPAGGKNVAAELVDLDEDKNAVLDINWVEDTFPGIYRRKRHIKDRYGIAANMDYSFLTQRASFVTAGEENTGASSVFRLYGTWTAVGDSEGYSGNLVWKFEHRGTIFGRQTPRDLGFATGSALSTANYKENGWGFTDFYWKTLDSRAGNMLLIGHMDPGDWADQHYLLNAWTNLLNDAFYNNPTEAIPKRGLSIVGRLGLPGRWYVAGGAHDANGQDNRFAWSEFWDVREVFSWAEIGFRSSDYSSFGETTHIHVWHQDERVEAGNEESWGVTFSASGNIFGSVKGMLRLGYAEGDAPQLREFVGGAVSIPTRGSDRFQLGFGWGSPPDKSLRSQTVYEFLYRLQFTQNLVLSPNLQITLNPSLTDETDRVVVVGLRVRLTF